MHPSYLRGQINYPFAATVRSEVRILSAWEQTVFVTANRTIPDFYVQKLLNKFEVLFKFCTLLPVIFRDKSNYIFLMILIYFLHPSWFTTGFSKPIKLLIAKLFEIYVNKVLFFSCYIHIQGGARNVISLILHITRFYYYKSIWLLVQN